MTLLYWFLSGTAAAHLSLWAVPCANAAGQSQLPVLVASAVLAACIQLPHEREPHRSACRALYSLLSAA